MSVEALRLWLPVLSSLISIGGIIYVWLTSQSTTNAHDIKQLVE